MFELIKKIFTVLLTGLVNGSNHTKYISLGSHKCEIQHTVINFYTNECSQELHCYPFAIKLDRCVESCHTLHDLSNKCSKQNIRFNPGMFNMITGINELKMLKKYISCKFDGRTCNSNVN